MKMALRFMATGLCFVAVNMIHNNSYSEETSSVNTTGTISTASTTSVESTNNSTLQGKLEKWYPGLSFLKSVTISGSLDLTYEYNFNSPKSGTNTYRVFDTEANSMAIRMFQLMFEKQDTNPGDVGFRIKLDFGEDSKVITPYGFSTNDFDLEEAYVNYKAPVGKGLEFTFGKWVTPFGAEVIESKDDYNISRSFLFGYAIPFTHTGLKSAYTFSDQVSGMVGVVNGWDDVEDNNSSVKGLAQITVTPIAPVTLALGGMYGPEEYHNNHDNRTLFDFVGTYKPLDKLTLVTNYDYGYEDQAGIGGGNARWQGLAGYVNYVFTPKINATARTEWFTDPEGARTGTAQDLVEGTLTGEYKLNDNFKFRAEYRHDHSNVASLESSTGYRSDDNTVALETLFTF